MRTEIGRAVELARATVHSRGLGCAEVGFRRGGSPGGRPFSPLRVTTSTCQGVAIGGTGWMGAIALVDRKPRASGGERVGSSAGKQRSPRRRVVKSAPAEAFSRLRPPGRSPEELERAKNGLIDHCDKSGLRFEHSVGKGGLSSDHISVLLGCGSSDVALRIRVDDATRIDRLLPDLERGVQVLTQCYGIAWPGSGRAEVVIEDPCHPPNQRGYYHSSPHDFACMPDSNIVGYGPIEISAADSRSGLCVQISDASEIIGELHASHRNSVEDFLEALPGPSQTLKISGIPAGNSVEFERVVNEVALSFSFDLEIRFGIGFKIGRRPEPRVTEKKGIREVGKDVLAAPLAMTMNAYDPEAASYYYHARRSESVPVAAFLGYYQVLEYYFRRFAMQSSIEVLRRNLKNPAFDVWSDGQLARLMSALSDELPDRTAERNQLRAVLTHAVDVGGLRELLDSVPGLVEHLRRKDRVPGIATVTTKTADQELLNQVADRIHQLRCQIVHSKGEQKQGEELRLLPDSRAAALVREDVRVVRYLAMSVICASADRLALRSNGSTGARQV